MLTPRGFAVASRQAFFKQYKEIEQKSYNAGNAGAHQSLLDHGEGFLDLLDDGIGNGHGIGARAVEGVGLQAVTVFGVPHFGDHAHGVALDVLSHEGGIMQVNAVAVVLHEAQGVGVVFGYHHFPGLAASQRVSGSYHNNY